MDDQTYQKYRKAGKIAAAARDLGVEIIREKVSFLEVVQRVEQFIQQQGAGLAFPVNISVNTLAAHFTPLSTDSLCFKRGDVVKLDVGAHVDGYIADTAVTVEVGTTNYRELIRASEQALNQAIQHIHPGSDLGAVGKVIEQTITSYGFKPIENLTGHSMKEYELHAGMSVPNINAGMTRCAPKVGDVLAIEPFATTGAGRVVSGQGSNIYLCTPSLKSRFIRDDKIKQSFQKLKATFSTLPFAHRWCLNLFHDSTDSVLKKLSYYGLIRQYPQLVEAKKGIVSQKEHTVIVTENGCTVIT
ncbi:MAG: type II methionyl aminopeptidase [Candidatus Thermoplasmatota archaeon]